MWEKPWKTKEGFLIGGGLIAVGILLQLTAGPIDWRLFSWPVNIVSLIILCIAGAVVYLLRNKVYLFKYLGTSHAAVPAIALTVLMTIVMGLTRQYESGSSGSDPLGIHHSTTSWPFVLMYLLMVIVMIQAIIKEIAMFSIRKIPALAFHIGLTTVLVTGTLGSADTKSLSMPLNKETPQWQAVDEYGNTEELPFAITLNRFDIEYFPAEGPGAISKRRMPKKFLADVDYLTKDGGSGTAEIEVNKPLKIASYRVYLDDYEQEDDGSVNVCTVGVVSDPWQWVIYTGAFLMLLGALLMFFFPFIKKEV